MLQGWCVLTSAYRSAAFPPSAVSGYALGRCLQVVFGDTHRINIVRSTDVCVASARPDTSTLSPLVPN